MVEPSDQDDQGTYEIRIQGEIPAAVLERYPTLDVHLTGTETVLLRDLADPTDLDRLLAQLQSLGLVLCELRVTSVPAPMPAVAEADEDV